MEAENKLYADMHGEGQGGQPPQDPPKYTTAAPQQPQHGSFGSQFHGYPPYGSPSAPVTPYYAAPSGSGYGGGYGNTQPAQQQQQVIVVGGGQPQVVTVVPVESYSGAIIYSCVVLWFCNFIFGLIGYVFAKAAQDNVITDPQGARKLGRASYIVSSVGIVVTIVIVAVCFGVVYGSCRYTTDGVCYHYSSYYTHTRYQCQAIDGVYYDGTCYYNL